MKLKWIYCAIFCSQLVMAPSCSAPIKWKTYQDTRQHIQFNYPSTWSFEKCIGGYKNGPDLMCLGFQSAPLKQQKYRDYDILFELQPLTLDQVLSEDLTFENSGDQWTRYTSSGVLKAKAISGATWKGVYVAADCNSGENYAAGDCLFAVISHGNRSAIFATSNAAATKIALKYMIPSFQFRDA